MYLNVLIFLYLLSTVALSLLGKVIADFVISKAMDVKKANKRKADSLKTKSKKRKLALSFPNPQQFRETALPQEFPFPMPMIRYIWKNPSSSNVYQKLIQLCKFFFLKDPILVINNLFFDTMGWKYCKESTCLGIYSCKHQHQKVDMNKLKSQKLWISKRLCINDYMKPDTASSIVPKTFRYNVKYLDLFNQKLSYDDFKFLSGGGDVKECYFGRNIVKYNDDKEVPLENIIKLFPGATRFYWNFDTLPFNAACESYDAFIDACSTIKEVKLIHIHAIFDVPKFYQHLKHTSNRTLFSIHSVLNNVLNKARFDELIDEILEPESDDDFVPPVIRYNGQDKAMLKTMEKIQAITSARLRLR